MGWKVNPKTGDILCTVGDTPSFKIRVGILNAKTNKVEAYEVEESDQIYINIKDGSKVLSTTNIDMENMLASLSKENTTLAPGEYKYDVVLEKESGYRCTFIANKNLILT